MTESDGLCGDHLREADAARGRRAARGYDTEYDRQRREWEKRLARGERVACWRCRRRIMPRDEWNLGHDDDDRTIIKGPEHAGCNQRAAGLAAHRHR
jgi:hypothetical protein